MKIFMFFLVFLLVFTQADFLDPSIDLDNKNPGNGSGLKELIDYTSWYTWIYWFIISITSCCCVYSCCFFDKRKPAIDYKKLMIDIENK